MSKQQTWFGDQAFGDGAHDLVTVAYKSHVDALKFLKEALADERGVAAVQGPAGSGKTSVVQRFADKLPFDTAVSIIDGNRIKPREMLSRVLNELGYDTGLESQDELVKMIRMVAIQQARAQAPFVLIVDNADRMFPSTLKMLTTLADLKVDDRFAIRIVVTGAAGLKALLDSEGMKSLAARNTGVYEMRPLALHEALLYLHARLNACGVANGDTVFPVDVCDRLYQQSGGWPGLMNLCAREAIGRAKDFPLRVSDTYPQSEAEAAVESPAADADVPELGQAEATGPLPPRIIVSRDGKTLMDKRLTEKKTLIGRSDFADILVEDDFVSKLHACLILYKDALVLLDLNSANGTTVNSVRIRSTVLRNDDVITLGHHRLKIRNAPSISAEMERILASPDTIRMKNLADVRRAQAQQNVQGAATKNKQS